MTGASSPAPQAAPQTAPQTVCHVFMSKLANESRLEKEIGFLHRAGFDGEIAVLGVEDPGVQVSRTLQEMAQVQVLSPEAPLRRVPILGKALRFWTWARQLRRILRQRNDSVIVIHSLAALFASCFLLRHSARIIYDAHEYETERNGFAPWQKRLARVAERLCIGKVSETWAVSPSIVAAYRKRYPDCPVRLIMNLPPAPDETRHNTAETDLRSRVGLGPERMVFGYLGALGPGRSIEMYLEVFSQLWDAGGEDQSAVPDLVILGDGSLRDLCARTAERVPNIHYLPPVAPDQVVAAARSFDVGLCLIDPSSLSYRFSLPNKFFQHLSAGNFVLVLEESEDMLGFARDDNRILTTRTGQLAQDMTGAIDAVSRNATAPFADVRTYYWESQEGELAAAFSDLDLPALQVAGQT